MSQLASNKGLSPAMAVLSRTFFSQEKYNRAVLQPRHCVTTTTVWAIPRSLATTGGIILLFSSPRGTKMFQFPRFASLLMAVIPELKTGGLSHSEICGSKIICIYPQLITSFIASVSLGIRHTPLFTFLESHRYIYTHPNKHANITAARTFSISS